MTKQGIPDVVHNSNYQWVPSKGKPPRVQFRKPSLYNISQWVIFLVLVLKYSVLQSTTFRFGSFANISSRVSLIPSIGGYPAKIPIFAEERNTIIHCSYLNFRLITNILDTL